MLQRTELFSLARDLAGTQVLTAYINGRVTNPAARDAWRPMLKAALRSARHRIVDADERARFVRAATLVADALPSRGTTWDAPSWVVFATEKRIVYQGTLPARVETAVAWRDGPMIGPFLHALKQLRPVVLALVDSESARLLRYASGKLESLDTLHVAAHDGPDPAPPDAVQRRKRAAFHRLATTLAARMLDAAGPDGVLLVAGTPEWAQRARAVIARRRSGVGVAFDLPRDASPALIVHAAKRAARRARAEEGRQHLGIALAESGRRSALGLPATRRAIGLKAVDALLVSPEWLKANGNAAEDLMRDALVQRADIELVSSDAAAAVDRVAGGVAARLRFAALASIGTQQTAATPSRQVEPLPLS
jgi:hypothetical protein